MMELRPLVVDANYMVLGGNKRLICLQNLGFKEIPDTWVKLADTLTPEEQRRFIIADNVTFGEWDWEELSNWGEPLGDWGLEVVDFFSKEDKKEEAKNRLQDKFIVPPFSVLDTRQGYWQERKRDWKELIGDLGQSREGKLFKGGGKKDGVTAKLHDYSASSGVSLLDPGS